MPDDPLFVQLLLKGSNAASPQSWQFLARITNTCKALALLWADNVQLLPAASAALSAQDSGSSGASGEQPQLGHVYDTNGALRHRSSNSGDEGAKGIGVRKSGPDRDKNRAAQKAFRQRKREQEKAKEVCLLAPCPPLV